MNVLYIDPSSSSCGACGENADPDEKQHDTILGYTPEPGCGAVFTHVGSHYSYPTIDQAARAMRPDLIWHGGM